MSCNHDSQQCICDIVRKIADAQSTVSENNDCRVSCSKSINELLSPTTEKLNTIPILLICKETCEFFIAAGVFRNPATMSFECFESPVFRVSKIIDDENGCCVALELLQPQTEEGTIPSCSGECGVCNFFPSDQIKKFIRTGICITVDLNCFCGIECLSPVNAIQGIPVPTPAPAMIVQEELCGNFGPGTQTVWQAGQPGIYIEGTFQIFNSSSSSGGVNATVTASPPVIFPPVATGTTVSRVAEAPVAFTITAPAESNGTYCLILYKRVPRDN